MIRRLISLAIVAIVIVVLFYISRFWPFRFWGNEGLFGIRALRPGGGLLAFWLRGTGLGPYELIIWAVGSFLLLTGLQKALDVFAAKPDADHD